MLVWREFQLHTDRLTLAERNVGADYFAASVCLYATL
jgi:hypothetical protein